MLGVKICDAHQVESARRQVAGLGFLPITTAFAKEKVLARVKARQAVTGLEVFGYEIHHGRTERLLSCQKGLRPAFKITERDGSKAKVFDGFVSGDGRVWGTYIHGVFDQGLFRRDFLNRLRLKKGLPTAGGSITCTLDAELDKLAQLLRVNLRMDLVYRALKIRKLAK